MITPYNAQVQLLRSLLAHYIRQHWKDAEIEEFDPGKTGTATFDLAAGRYVLVCNIVQDEPDGTKESHYLMGMSTEFTVK